MKILITGGAGFVGSNISNRLNDKHTVLAVDNLSFGARENLHREVNFIEQGFEELDPCFLNKFDVLIHCATANIIYAQDHEVETFKTNALDTIDLFRRFKGFIIYTSTASVYGDANELPTTEDAEKKVSNAYDQSKLIAEKYLELRGNYTTLRLSNVYGMNQRPGSPYAGVVAKFMQSAMYNEPFNVYGDGSSTRDYTHISDVVDAVELAIVRSNINDVVNISGDCELSILDLIKYITDAVGCDKNIHHIKGRRIDNINRRVLSISKAEKVLGYSPSIGIEEGLYLTYKWVNSI